MTKIGWILLLALALTAAATLACRDSNDNAPTPPANTAGVTAAPSTNAPAPAVQTAPAAQSAASPTGIWVAGEGTIDLEPDLALLNVGVEVQAETVSEARGEAAAAMDAVIAAVKARGLTDADIQTASFNIWPRYDYVEGVQTLAGYRVSNTATIKMRDLDSVGDIIDDVAEAGGDATRIDGISFTVEDPTPFMADLREAAVKNATDKAQHYADLIGASLGDLFYLTETGGASPPTPVARAEFALADTSGLAKTSVSGGELTLRMTVQAAFAIE